MLRRPVIRCLLGLPVALVAAVLVALSLGSLAAVAWRAEGWSGLRPSDWGAVRFTLLQSALSAGLSVALAVPVARALARRQFLGRGLLITVMGAPFILPTLVAVLGLLAVFGQSGLVSDALALFGLPPVQIYGLHGVVLAHVFFNLPLAVRLILHGWQGIPAERFRLAASLGFTPRDTFRQIEAPMLRGVLPGAALVIFLICLTSFAVALTLGGGPAATTVELAIYQAFRFDFDLSKAALLGLIQFGLCAGAAVISLRVTLAPTALGGMDRALMRWDLPAPGWDAAVVTLAAAFLLVPLAVIMASGLGAVPGLPVAVWQAAARSVAVALGATALTLCFALLLALAIVRVKQPVSAGLETIGMLSLAASPLVMGTGLFILLFPLVEPARIALAVTMLVNAAMALPFVLRAILPPLREVEATHGRLSDSLGLTGWARFRIVTLPRLRRPLGFAAGLTAALSMGDLGVIVLFAEPDGATLPLMLYRLMGAYRLDNAAGAAVLLLGASLLMFWVFDRWGRGHAAV
nr:thiamine/thiamine pyrophosphate ABC transporter permease ThiP [Roseicitreum antarcticum]